MARTLPVDRKRRAFRRAVGRFLDQEIVPHLRDLALAGGVSRATWERAGEVGLLCRNVERKFGGHGDDFFSSVVVIEEIARRRLHNVLFFYLHSDVVVPYLVRFGSLEQRHRYLPDCAGGRTIAALAITEPHSGSDLRAARTTAARQGNDYVLDGEKTHVSCGSQSSLLVVSARSSTSNGLILLLVDASTPGVEREVLPRQGLSGLETSRIRFRDCRVPVGNRLGADGMGLVYLMEMLATERLVLAIAAQASCRHILGELIHDCSARHTRDGSVLVYQNTRFVLAELAAECAVNQAFVDKCVSEHARAGITASDAAIAKLRTTETLKRTAIVGVQFRGAAGMGPAPGAWATQDLLDSCVQTIWGGPSEVMKEIIADDLRRWVEM